MSQIRTLQVELDNMEKKRGAGEYRLSEYSRFEVNERGKTRAITALCIRDRVVKHALNDLFLIPHIRPHLIYDNGASLEGKGVSFTRNRMIAHLESFFRETGSNDGYIMTMDFSGYYDNIDHERAMQMIRKYEPDEFARRLVQQAYNSYRVDVSDLTDAEFELAKHSKFSMVQYRKQTHRKTGEKFLHKSVSVGDQTSQITAISFPTPIDKLATTVCGFRYYARYMDDIYVIAKTREELYRLRDRLEEMACRLKIFINPRKTVFHRIDKTFTFLQFKYCLRESGHVVVRIHPKTVTRMRRRLKRLHRRVVNGETRHIKVLEMFRSWIANFGPMLAKKQRINLIELYQNLFGKELDPWMKQRGII